MTDLFYFLAWLALIATATALHLLNVRCNALEAKQVHMEGYLSALKTSPTAPVYQAAPTPEQIRDANKHADQLRAVWKAQDQEAESFLRRELGIPIEMPIGHDY